MKTHKKTKIEILIEAPFEEKLTELLDDLGAKGYTIFPAISGKGEHGHWSRKGLVNHVGQMLLFVSIVENSKARHIAEKLYEATEDQFGIITLSEVEVFRSDKF